MKIYRPLHSSPGFRPLAMVCAGVLSVALSFVEARAAVISVNFQGTNPTAMVAGDVTGVYSAGNWNNVTGGSGSSLPLVDSSGAASGITLDSFASFGAQGGIGNNSNAQQTLFGGSLSLQSFSPITIQLSGLEAFSSYSVVVYYNAGGGDFGASREMSATATGSAVTYYGVGYNFNTTTPTTSYVRSVATAPGTGTSANYLEFTGLTAATQTITLSSNNALSVVGFQINGVAVPEPSSVVLIVGAVAGYLAIRRRAGA